MALLVAVASVAGAAAAGALRTEAGASPVGVAEVETTGTARLILSARPDTVFRSGSGPAGGLVVRVDDRRRFQPMVGFGATMTDSAAYVLMRDLDPAKRARLVEELFGPRLGLDVLRVPIGANDFSTSDYSDDQLAPGHTDFTLSHFTLRHDLKNLVPAVKAALAVNPHLTIIATPWSAPAWMKTSHRLGGGFLLPGYLGVYAAYLTRFVRAYRALGIDISYLTMENEPDFVTPAYPGMLLSPEREADLVPILARDLARAGLRTRILGFDSDWSSVAPYARVLLGDPAVARQLAGFAFHCYNGDPRAQLAVEAAYPRTAIWETECTGYASVPGFASNLVNGTNTLIVDAIRDGARAVLLWNLVLDQSYGPTNGGCRDCVPNATVNTLTGRSELNVESYVLAQAAAFVRPGAVRVASSDLVADGLETVAWQNPGGQDVLLVLDRATHGIRFTVRWDGRWMSRTIPGSSVETFTWG